MKSLKKQRCYGRISDMEQLKNHPQNNFLEIETKNGKVKVLGPGAIHDNFIPEVNKMPELDEHGKKLELNLVLKKIGDKFEKYFIFTNG